MKSLPSRRRFIGIIAAASGLAMAPGALRHALASVSPPAPSASWRGIALGADAQLHIYHSDPATAQALIAQSLAEVRRLEKVFSLYREDSALFVLNRQGYLDNPPADLLRLLSESQYFSELTGGAFDPTVQPLWNLYAGHFSRADADPDGPGGAAIARALALVGHDGLALDPAQIRYRRAGMGLTLNGIA
ncbi:MAG: FAD:protein FMN transferase, partial [Pollutimonas bauzanensis]